MKNLAILFSCFVLISCSKDSNLVNLDLNQQYEVQLIITNALKVGEVNGAGNTNITYDVVELSELTSCAVSENSTTALIITNETPGYYLSGLGASKGPTNSLR